MRERRCYRRPHSIAPLLFLGIQGRQEIITTFSPYYFLLCGVTAATTNDESVCDVCMMYRAVAPAVGTENERVVLARCVVLC